MKTYTMPYGKGEQTVSLPEDHILYELHGTPMAPVEDEGQAVLDALRHPIGSAPLTDIVKSTDTVAIVVSDITRLVHTDRMLPVIVSELNSIGVKDDQITVIVATGTHRGHTDEENITVCGEDMVKRLRIVQHDCKDKDNLTYIGKTSFGNEVYINSVAAKADKLILTGAVSFHPMAGYGGGRKALLPGIAGFDSIMHNHCLALAEKPGDGCNPGCDTGLLAGNPFNEDMTEACAMVKPAFLVNTVFSSSGELFEVVAGDWYKAWEQGCKDLLAAGSASIEQQADVTIASAGGYPKDLNLYQGTKTHMNAVFATKPGGIMILCLQCPDIKEPAIFTDWFFRNDLDQVEQDLRDNFLMPGFVAFKGRCIIRDMQRVYVVTEPENFDIIRQSGQVPAVTLEDAWAMAEAELKAAGKDDYTITLIDHAPAVLPVMVKNN